MTKSRLYEITFTGRELTDPESEAHDMVAYLTADSGTQATYILAERCDITWIEDVVPIDVLH